MDWVIRRGLHQTQNTLAALPACVSIHLRATATMFLLCGIWGGPASAQTFGGLGGGTDSTPTGGPGGSYGVQGNDGPGSAAGFFDAGGGGGGGVGAAGGSGGQGGPNLNPNYPGGVGGLGGNIGSVGVNGGDGGIGGDGQSSNTWGSGGGGGGGGGTGIVTSTGVNISASTSGGAGGVGGSTQSGGGGGGGAGGFGLNASGAIGVLVHAGVALRGGTGGGGGASGDNYQGGAGGGGGVGAYFAMPGSTLTNAGVIIGGAGGAAGAGAGCCFANTPAVPGAGGVGVVGAGLTINNAGGTITGGISGDGITQAAAIQLTGGTNYVGGAGTINGGINVAAGSFQPALPGSAVGTPLMVNGPVSFAPGTFYNVRITPTTNDSLVATGQATLTGATVTVLAGDGTYTVGTRQILSVATRGGTTFASVTSNLAFLMPTLTYVGDGLVFLNIQAGTTVAPPIATVNPVTGEAVLVPDYRSAAETLNQYAVAGGLTNAGIANEGTGKILNAFNQLTVTQARAAFDSVSGEGITATQNLAYRSAQLFNAAIFDQTTFYGSGGTGNSVTLTAPQPGFFAYSPQVDAPRAPIHELADLPNRAIAPEMPAFAPTRTWRAWGSGFGGADDIHGNGTIGSAAQNNDIYGGAIGVDYQVTPNYLAGIAVGGSDGEFSVPGRATSGSTTGGHIAFYDIATFGSFYGASSNSFSYFTNRTTRTTGGFGGLGSETDRGSFDSHEFRTRLEFGRHFDGYGATITPFIALELAELRSNGFNESAVSGPGLLALNVSGQSSASVPAFVGVRFQRITTLGGGVTFSPTLQVAYVHEFAPQRTQTGTLVDLPGSTFLVDGARPGRDAGQVKFGGELALNAHSFLFANFDGEFSGLDQFYGGHGGFKYVW